MIDQVMFMKALREAFDAGRDQGRDEATAYEWGSSPSLSADRAFDDLTEGWNTGPIRGFIETYLPETGTETGTQGEGGE